MGEEIKAGEKADDNDDRAEVTDGSAPARRILPYFRRRNLFRFECGDGVDRHCLQSKQPRTIAGSLWAKICGT